MTIDERLEKLAERHEALTETVELLAQRQADAEKQHEREMSDIRREAAAMRADFRRAVALGVREARNERRRRQELDARFDLKMDQLASAQLLTEEKLQGLYSKMDAFIDSMRHGGNGRA
ncbi:MAG TPA: hypothetical protein VMG35_27195 [Bryobacteraceae bacterium]|nr:hypothetical protein [Bryobacteraceae bacterium]